MRLKQKKWKRGGDGPIFYENNRSILFVFNESTPANFVFSNTNYNFYNKYMWKNVHPVNGPGIRTHNLWNKSPPITTRPGLHFVTEDSIK